MGGLGTLHKSVSEFTFIPFSPNFLPLCVSRFLICAHTANSLLYPVFCVS